jgi:hypothetical protein
MLSNQQGVPHAIMAKALLGSSPSLLMDADLEVDTMVKTVAAEIWTPEQIKVHRYTHVALPRKIAAVPLTEWMQSLKTALQTQKRVMVAFRSKSDLQTVTETVKQWFPQLKYLAFSSDSTETDMEAFQRINEEAERVQLLCFTSKVTVGADIQTRFDQVYLHAHSIGGCTAREAFQMIGRARNVTDTTVRVVFPPARPEAQIVTYDSQLIMKDLMARRSLRQKYADVVCSREPILVGGTFQWSPDWITRVLACYLAEQASDFTEAFRRLAIQKRYQFVPAEDQPAVGENVTKALREGEARVAAEDSARRLSVLHILQSGTQVSTTLQSDLRALEAKIAQGEATPEERIRHDLLRVWQHFPEHFWDMTPEQVVYAHQNALAFYKIHWWKNNERQQDARWLDVAKLAKGAGSHAVWAGLPSRSGRSSIGLPWHPGLHYISTRRSL